MRGDAFVPPRESPFRLWHRPPSAHEGGPGPRSGAEQWEERTWRRVTGPGGERPRQKRRKGGVTLEEQELKAKRPPERAGGDAQAPGCGECRSPGRAPRTPNTPGLTTGGLVAPPSPTDCPLGVSPGRLWPGCVGPGLVRVRVLLSRKRASRLFSCISPGFLLLTEFGVSITGQH